MKTAKRLHIQTVLYKYVDLFSKVRFLFGPYNIKIVNYTINFLDCFVLEMYNDTSVKICGHCDVTWGLHCIMG